MSHAPRSTPPDPRPHAPWGGRFAAAFACAVLVGCGGSEPTKIEFDEISRLPHRERQVEVRLGRFVIPAPLTLNDTRRETVELHLLRVSFDLYAMVDPEDVKQVKNFRKANEGRMRERVIQVCRGTTREDLFEPEWTTLKAHLLDAVQPMLGGAAVKRLSTTRIEKDLL
jgi:hypothetical protein